MAVSVKGGGGGGTGSSDVTAPKSKVMAGYTAVTTDSNDEPIEGTLPLNTVMASQGGTLPLSAVMSSYGGTITYYDWS